MRCWYNIVLLILAAGLVGLCLAVSAPVTVAVLFLVAFVTGLTLEMRTNRQMRRKTGS